MSTPNSALSILDALADANDPHDVFARVERFSTSQEVIYMSLRTPSSPRGPGYYSTLPDQWIDHYISENYMDCDPGVSVIKTATQPVAMSFDASHPTYHAVGRSQQMFDEMAEIGARGTFFVPIRTPGGAPNAGVNYLTNLSGRDFDAWIAKMAPTLRIIANLLHSHISQWPSRAGDDTENPLAARERECLLWLGNGLRPDRIAEKMSISPRTVEFHLKNARLKLRANTREHAVALAITNGFIAFQ